MAKKLTPQNGILQSPPYVAGKHSIDGVHDIAILSANENPLGCSPTINAVISKTVLHRYPDGSAIKLRQSIGALHNLNPDNIVCGAGSGEILQLLIRAYAGDKDEVLYPEHGFLIYPIATLTVGATPVKATETNYTVSVDNMLTAVTDKTKIICLANPANPTGTLLEKSEIKRLVENVPTNILIILDSAYAEYANTDVYTAGADMVDLYPNVVMVRTFSKAYGLASVRLGWCYASNEIVDVLHRVRSPFNTGTQSQLAGIASIKDQEFIKKSIAHNNHWRQILKQLCEDKGLCVPNSFTNFILVKFSSEKLADKAYDILQNHGVIARLVKGYGLPDCLRITIGTESENKKVMNAIAEFEN